MSEVWSSPALRNIAELITQRTGIVTARSPIDLERAVRDVMARCGLRDVADLAQRLAAGSHWQELLDQVTIRETYFFRNPEHFAYVTNTVLPALCEQRAPGAPLRVWSAGCASGEEAYSLAIMLQRAGKLDVASVLGTDLSHAALDRARAGRYREWSFRAIDPEIVPHYFRQEQGERVICDELRAHVQFAKLNLLDIASPAAAGVLGPFDLIFCRNVMIYFDPQSVAQIERGLFHALAPGGWLIPGPSDPPLGQSTALEVILHEHGVCYRRPAVPPIAPRATLSELPPSAARAPIASSLPHATPRPERRIDSDAPTVYAQALRIFECADYTRVIEIARRRPSDLRLCILGTRAIWNQSGAEEAERACAHSLRKHGLSAELHYLHAITLVDCRRQHDALLAVRRSLYLDRALTIAHFAHASILERLHDLDGARRAYRNTYDACARHSPDEELPLGDGILAKGLANAAAHALKELDKRCLV